MDNDFEMDDVEDLVLDKHDHEITDAVSDPERRRASVHRGAAYLQDITYPPHGSSHGQEGGVMDMSDEIVFGYHDLGCDVLGAAAPLKLAAVQRAASPLATQLVNKGAPAALASKMATAKVTTAPRAGFVLKTTPGGRQVTSLVLGPTRKTAASIKNAQDAGKRAIAAGNKLVQVAQTAAKAKTTPVVPVHVPAKTPTRVHGAIAARHVTVPARRLTGVGKKLVKVRLPPAKLKALGKKAVKAGNDAIKAAGKLTELVQHNQARVAAGASAVRKLLSRGKTKTGQTLVRGDDFGDSLDAFEDDFDFTHAAAVLGGVVEALGEENLIDAVESGDEFFGADPLPTGPMDEGSATTADSSVDAAAVDANDPYGYIAAIGPPPTMESVQLQPNIDYVPDPGPDNDQTAYSSDLAKAPGAPVPEGAVFYDNSHGLPDWGFGSWQIWYGSKRDGKRDGVAYRNQSWWAGGINHDPGWMEQHGDSMDTLGERGHGTPIDSNSPTAPLTQLQKYSLDNNWGPLIGHPEHGWTKGLRYDAGSDRWFWFYDGAKAVAPWATSADEMEHFNKAVLDYKAAYTAAVADTAAQLLADQMDAQAQKEDLKTQALEDAADQRQIEKEQLAAQHDASLQAIADETAARQAAAAGDEESRQAALEDERAARQAELEATLEERRAQAEQERDLARMEREAELRSRYGEPEDEGASEEEPASEEEEETYDDAGQPAYDFEESPLAPVESDDPFANVEDEVMGGLRGSARIRARAARRR